MVRVGLRQQSNRAGMRSHSVNVERRSGDTFSPIPVGGMVQPGEAVRYRANGANTSLQVQFRVLDPVGFLVFDFTAQVNATGSAWTDTVAPNREGPYTLTAEASNIPGLPFTHFADTGFVVSVDAPPPPTQPPSTGSLGNIKWIIVGLGVLAAIVILGPTIGRIGSHIPRGED